MGTGQYITYDSSWSEICASARVAPWAMFPSTTDNSLQRPPLSHDEVIALTGIPVALIDEDYVPPHPEQLGMAKETRAYTIQLKAREACLRYMVVQSGLCPHTFNYEEMAEMTLARCYFKYGDDPNGIRLQGASAETLDGPLQHRLLAGPRYPVTGAIITSAYYDHAPAAPPAAQRKLEIPPTHYYQLCQLHEVFHLVQCAPAKNCMSYLATRERDAENASLISYQSVFGGDAALAAGCIMTHMATLPFEAPTKCFWPGLPVERLHEGPTLMHNLLSRTQELAGQPLDHLQFLTFLSDNEPAWEELYPAESLPLARILLDAGRFSYPQMLDFDPVKPRMRAPRTVFGQSPTAA